MSVDHTTISATAITSGGDRRMTARELAARAERWRPWRAYAAQHLWARPQHKRGAVC